MAKSDQCQRARPRPTRLFEVHPSTVGRDLAKHYYVVNPGRVARESRRQQPKVPLGPLSGLSCYRVTADHRENISFR
jgi:hypothetical protein